MLHRFVVPAIVLFALALLAACGGSGQVKELRADLDTIVAAINEGDAARLYDEFSDDGCTVNFSRQVFIANFEEAPFQISDLQLLDENIHIEDDTAYIIVTATFTFADGRQETKTFFETLVKAEDTGRWRDQDCFRGGLGGQPAPGEFIS